MALAPEYKNRIINAAMKMEQDGIPPEEIQGQVNRFKDIYDPDARIDETEFRSWYEEKSLVDKLPESPDDPNNQLYNYRAAFRSGVPANAPGLPPKFKREGSPDLIQNGVDVRTGKAPDWDMFENPTPYFEQFQKTGIAVPRSRKVTGAPVGEAQIVPVENVRAETMQLEGPGKQAEIMEPMSVTPAKPPSIGSTLKRAGAKTADLVSQIPSFLVDMQLTQAKAVPRKLQKELADPNTSPERKQEIQNMISKVGAEAKKVSDIYAKNPVSNFADDVLKNTPSITDKYPTVADAYKQNGIKGLAEYIGHAGLEESGTTMLLLGSSMLPGGTAVGLGAMGAGSAGLKNKELQEKIDNGELKMSEGMKYANSLGTGAFELIPEIFGTGAIVNGLKGAFIRAAAKEGKEVAQKSLSATTKAMVVGFLKGWGMELADENVTEIAQLVIDNVTGAKKDQGSIQDQIKKYLTTNLPELAARTWTGGTLGAVTGAVEQASGKLAPPPPPVPEPTPILEPAPTPKLNVDQAMAEMTPDEKAALFDKMKFSVNKAINPQGVGANLSDQKVADMLSKNPQQVISALATPVDSKAITAADEERVKTGAEKILNSLGTTTGEAATEESMSLRKTTNEMRSIFGEETNTPAQAVEKYDAILNKLGVKTYRDLAAMKATDLEERLRTLDAKEQTFVDRVDLGDIESYKNEQERLARMGETVPLAKGVQNGQEKGRVQVAAPEYRSPSTQEFKVMTPEQKDQAYTQLKEESETDQLTSLINRQGAKDRGYIRMEKVMKDGEEVTEPVWQKREDGTEDMAVLDIDNFGKGVNNYYGHPTGDKVLTALGKILTHNLKGLADVVRYGGEEIAIIPLKNANRDGILKAVEESRSDLHAQVFKTPKGDLTGITFSAGYGNNNDGADAALYKAKESGKARTFSGENQYAENDLRPTEIREPRRRTEDTSGSGQATGTVLPGKGKTPAKSGVGKQKNENDISTGISGKLGPGQSVSGQTSGATTVPNETGVRGKGKKDAGLQRSEEGMGLGPEGPAANEVKPDTVKKPEPTEAPAEAPTEASTVTNIKKKLDDATKKASKVLGKNAPKINVKLSKDPPPDSKKLVGKDDKWEAAVWYNPKGKVVEVWINENLDPIKYAEALYHEIPGHIGQRLVFADSPNILNTMRQMFAAAKSRDDMDVRALKKAYKGDIEKAKDAGDDVLFEEWVAHNLHRYLIQNDRTSLPKRIYNLFRSALIKIGVLDKKVDDVLREMIKKMSKAKDIGIIESQISESFKRPVEEEVAPAVEKSVTPGEVNLDVNDETKFDAFRRVTTDRYFRLRRLMEAAEKKTGTPLSDDLNTYVKQDIINSKIADKVDSFQKEYIDQIADIATKNGLSVKEMDDYLYAKHAPEANEVVGKRRPDMVKEGKPASGMSNEEAANIIKAAEASGKKASLEKVSGIVQKWNKARLDMMVKDELMTPEQRDQFLEEYKNYVPLKGLPDEEGNDVQNEIPHTGKGYNVGAREFRMRKGRSSKAQNLLAHLAVDTVEKAVRGDKNKVIQSLYKFNKGFKNELIQTEPVVIEKEFDKKSGTFKDRKKSNFEISQTDKYGAPINFKINGEPMQMLIKDVPLMRAMRNMGSSEGDTFSKILMKYMMPVQRYLSMVRTQLSLNFIPSNFLRDTMTAQLNSLGLNLPKDKMQGLSLAILKGVPGAMKAAYEGKSGKDTEGAKKYNEFVKEGGAIEFFGLKDVDAIQKSLVAQINNMKPGLVAGGKRVMKNAYEYITILNGAVENANRLATYNELTSRGISKQQAAYIAKNLTTNFNRKGELGTFLNAYSLFANASIQGSVRLLKAFKDSKTVRNVAYGIIASSVGFAELMRTLAGDDPEDKENYYDKISDFTRDTHLILPLGKLAGKETKNYLRIPLPYGYNVFWALGQHISRAIHGEAKEIPGEALKMLGVVADAFNPIGGSVDLTDPKSMARNFAPTITQPLIELAVNQNFMGAPVVKEQVKGYGPQAVASHSALKSTPESIKSATAWANDITGGGKYRPGMANISPDVISHLWDFGTGGVGKLLTDMISIPLEWKSDKKVSLKTIPLAQRFYGEINEYKDVKTLYDNLEKAQRIYKDFNDYKKDDPEKARKLMRQYPAIISLLSKKEGETVDKNLKTKKGTFIPLNRRVTKKLEDLNKLRQKYDEKGDKEAVKKIEERIINHAQEWNAKLDKFLKPLPNKEKGNP